MKLSELTITELEIFRLHCERRIEYWNMKYQSAVDMNQHHIKETESEKLTDRTRAEWWARLEKIESELDTRIEPKAL